MRYSACQFASYIIIPLALTSLLAPVVLPNDKCTCRMYTHLVLTPKMRHVRRRRKLRDELSHNLFLMLQECNKFREHQAREILIDTLERQLERRNVGLASLREEIGVADMALEGLREFKGKS